MSDRSTLEDRLEELGAELRCRPSVAEKVMKTLKANPIATKLQHEPSPERRRKFGLRFKVISTLATVLLAAVAIVMLSRPDSLYARAMAALSQVDTIHVTGWTTRIVRRWPLEKPEQTPAEVKHSVDGWFWNTDDGIPRSWRKMGPVTQNETGTDLQEYQEDVDLLFTRRGGSKDHVERFSTLASYLKALDRTGMKKEQLGTRKENDRTLSGLRIVEGNRTREYWFDTETDLPVRYTQQEIESDGTDDSFALQFEYNQAVPEEVVAWKPPAAKNLRYGSGDEVQQAWKDHVAEVGERVNRDGGEAKIRLLDRDGKRFSLQYHLKTPDSRWWVLPLDLDQYMPMDLQHFIRTEVAIFTPLESWKAPQELLDMDFRRQDLVFREGVSWEEWVQFVLNAYDLEYVDQMEDRTVWIAHHDGRELKPWKEVSPPVPYLVEGGVEKRGVVRPGIGFQLHPVTMHQLFKHFTDLQNHYLTADGAIIEDRTGLPKLPAWDREKYETVKEYETEVKSKFYVATDSPWFAGGRHAAESQRLAREWFRKEFGVTFTEEKRPMTVHAIRRKVK